MTTAERDKVRLFGLLKMLETPRHASRLAQNCPTQAKKLDWATCERVPSNEK
jgi:hypothetical protein